PQSRSCIKVRGRPGRAHRSRGRSPGLLPGHGFRPTALITVRPRAYRRQMADLAARPVPLAPRMRPWDWVALDAVVALILLLPVGGGRPHSPGHQNPWLSVLVLGVTLVFPARRRFPVAVCLLLTAATITLATSAPPYNGYGPFAMMFALYTVATTRPGRVTALASAGVLAAALAILTDLHYPPSVVALSGVAIGVAPSLTGYVVRQ